MDENKTDQTTTPTGTGTPEVESVVESVVNEIKEEATEEITEDTVVSEVIASTDVAPLSTVSAVTTSVASFAKVFNYKIFFGAILAILVIAVGLIFLLEKEGRISTQYFSSIIEKIDAKKPAASVNGTVITKAEYNSSLGQLMQMASTQGADTNDAAVLSSLKTQTLDTLVNGELLRQAAVAAGKAVTAEQITTRYTEIETGLGGAEAMATKMSEFGVDADSLKHDIENEFLIQAFFDEKKIGQNYVEVTDLEISALYNKAKETMTDLPPLAEVKEQVAGQIKLDKEQAQINELLKTLRESAKVEILI
jgi:SurA N-terminal domain